MKKIISILCALSMLLSLVVVAQASGVKIEIDEKTLVQGTGTESVEVPLELSGNTGIAGMTLQISYDEGLEITGVQKGPALGSMTLTEDGDYLTANPFNLLWDGKDADATNGVIAILTFTVPKNQVKTYHVSATLDSAFDDDVQDVSIAIVNGGITITEAPKADFTGLSLTDKVFTYDGNEKSLTVAGNIPAGANVTYKYDGSTDKPTDVGEYDVEAVVTKDGYNDLTLNATMTINPKNLTVSGMSAQNKEYDGTANASVSGGTLSGKVSGDDVDATFPTSGTFASTNVGSNIAVSIDDITLTGSDKDNYTLTQPTGLKANITKRPITATARSYTIRQNTAVPALEYDITSGSLVPGDEITGALSVNATGTTVGTFDITKGTLEAGSNYNMTFVKGTLTVSAKDVQDVTVAAVPSKTYGDAPFELDVVDNNSSLGDLTYVSSDTDVATVSADGTVTVKAEGTTNITVSRAGNEQYADFTVTKALTVSKKPITVTARNYTIKQNNAIPALEYDITSGSLVSGDEITGALTVNADGTSLGDFEIKQGTLTAGANYDLTFVKGTLTVVDKTPQAIVFDEIDERTYGDASFVVTVTPDSTTQLDEFTFESSDTDVAEVAADGTVTIKAAGETDITVKQAGNDEYAAFEKTQKLIVNKKDITVDSVDLENKTGVLGGVLDADTAVTLDFDKLNVEVIGTEDETTNVKITNFILTGEKAENYTVTTTEVTEVVGNENIVEVTIVAENGTATGAGTHVKGYSVTVSATPDSGYKFSGWYVNGVSVSTSTTYTFVAEENTDLVAKFSKKASGGGITKYTVMFDSNGGSNVSKQSVARNTHANKPVEPTRDGYTFAGWYTDEELTNAYDFSSNVTGNLTLYAKWIENTPVAPEVTESPIETDAPEATESPLTETVVFDDVKESDWYNDSVNFVVENKLMNGVSETEFAPNATLTRAMLVTVLYRNEGEPEIKDSNAFEDIVSGAYYEKAVAWAQANGIVEGVTDTEFAPDAEITREQIATIMHRYAKYKNYDITVSADIEVREDYAEISDYAVDAMKYMVGCGFMNGKTDKTLDPKDDATRAEIATVLQRFILTNN